MPEYEKICVNEYTNGGEDRLVFSNPSDIQYGIILNTIKD